MIDLQDLRLQFASKLRDYLRRNLESTVLDIMSHPSEVPEEFFEYIQIAREQNFTDIKLGFEEILIEIGRIQTQRAIQRRQHGIRREEEKALQEYLVRNNGKKLEDIEPGLKYIAHEKVVRSGRLDIATEDREGREVRIELKAEDYDTKKVYPKVMAYFNDDKTGKARLIFVAHKLNPDLILGLAQYERTGRMSFFLSEKVNGRYTFTRIRPDDIPEPKQINWTTKARRKARGLVKVTELPRERTTKEEKRTEEEWNRLPLYEKVRRIYALDITPQQRDISQGEFNHLERLVLTPEQLERFKIWEEIERLNALPLPEILKKMYIPEIKKNTIDMVKNHLENFGDITRMVETEMVDIELSKLERIVRTGGIDIYRGDIYRGDLGKEVKVDTRGVLDYLRLIRRMVVDDINVLRNNKKVKKSLRTQLESISPGSFEIMIQLTSIDENRLRAITEAMSIKERRTRELLKYDPNLAKVYLIFTTATFAKLVFKGVYPQEFQKAKGFYFDERDLGLFVAADNQLYQELLEFFVPIPEPQPEPRKQQETKVIIPTPKPDHTIEDIAPIDRYTGPHVSDDSRLRAQYFLEEVLNNPEYPKGLRKRLAREARRSRWYAKDLSDVDVRNLFDDWTLEAMGSKPSQQ